MAATSGDGVYAWGSGLFGDRNELRFRSAPVSTNVVSGLAQAAFGADHTLLLNQSGELYGLGGNVYGELGLGDSQGTLLPVRLLTGG